MIGNVFSLTVDLRNNPLRRVHFNEPEYYALKGARKVGSFYKLSQWSVGRIRSEDSQFQTTWSFCNDGTLEFDIKSVGAHL